MNILTIIARYQEDLSWVENLDTDVAIYNKGESFHFDYPRIDIENIGRETETFLRAIIEYYDKINDYDAIVFLQGNPLDHCENVVEIINNTEKCDELLMLSDSINTGHLVTSQSFNNKFYWLISYLLGESLANICEDQSLGGYKSAILCECLGIKLDEKIHYEWASGAQYMIPSSFIINRGYDWWENTYNIFLLYLKVKNTGQEAPYVFEFSWPLLFDPKYKVFKHKIE